MAKKKRRTKPSKPRGRPAVFAEAKLRHSAIKHIEEGSTLTEAAHLCGCGYTTLNNAVKADESFRLAVAAAKIRRRANWKKTINRSAKKDWRAAAFLLACEEAGSYRPNRPVHNTTIENEVNVPVAVTQAVQTALHDPNYLEFLRDRAGEADRNAGLIRQDSQQEPVDAGSASGLPGPSFDRHDHGSRRLPPAAGDDAAETRKE